MSLQSRISIDVVVLRPVPQTRRLHRVVRKGARTGVSFGGRNLRGVFTQPRQKGTHHVRPRFEVSRGSVTRGLTVPRTPYQTGNGVSHIVPYESTTLGSSKLLHRPEAIEGRTPSMDVRIQWTQEGPGPSYSSSCVITGTPEYHFGHNCRVTRSVIHMTSGAVQLCLTEERYLSHTSSHVNDLAVDTTRQDHFCDKQCRRH